jgi:hypothetical protein
MIGVLEMTLPNSSACAGKLPKVTRVTKATKRAVLTDVI